MTFRELIERGISFCTDMDTPMMARIIERDAEGCVTHVRRVPIHRWHHHNELVIEQSDIDQTPREKL